MGLVRPSLQRRPRQRLRQPREPHGVDDQALPRRRAAGAAAGARLAARPRAGTTRSASTPSALEGCRAPRRPGRAVGVRRRREPGRRCGEALGAGEGLEGGRRGRRAIGCAASWATSSRPAGWSGSRSRRSCRPRRRASWRSSASAYGYGPDGNGESSILGELEWGARASEAGRVGDARAAVPAPRGRDCETAAAAATAVRRRPDDCVRLIDSHCHVNADRFADDAEQVLERPAPAGVERILVPGWNVASCERARELAERVAWIDIAVGVHPHDAAKVDDAGWRPDRRMGAGRAGRRDRRDRARLRPRLQPDPGPARPTCGGTSASRPTPASRRSCIAARAQASATPRTRCSPS